MNLLQSISEQLEKLTGQVPDLRPLPPRDLKGVPVYLAAGFRFVGWTWMDQELVIALCDELPKDWTPSEGRHQARQLTNHLGKPVVFAFPTLDAYQRNRLVQFGVSFMVPGLQLFIPPFAHLTERFQRIARVGEFSAAAQVTVLYRLLEHPADDEPLNRYAQRLGYSAMTLTKVRQELVAAGLCATDSSAKPRGLHFMHTGRSLWDAALPHLSTPVRRVVGLRDRSVVRRMPAAGITALGKTSLIQDDAIPTYAMRDTDWRKQAERLEAMVAPHPEEAVARVELWRYAPALLGSHDRVDSLSLHLSLAGSPDERIRLAAASLLESVTW